MSYKKFYCFLALCFSLIASVQADLFQKPQERTTLPPEEAFQLTISQKGTQFHLDWKIADGYYLYRDKVKIHSLAEGISLSAPSFPKGTWVEDEYFGKTEVYRNNLNLFVGLDGVERGLDLTKFKVDFQGCADIGVCYPPMSQVFEVGSQTLTMGEMAKAESPSESSGFIEWDQPTWLLILLYFIVGIGLSFTPCVLPMIPIVASIIAGENKQDLSASKAFKLTLAYVLAMALTYALIGIVAANVGHTMQGAMQNVWVISGVCVVFVLLSLSMFGWYDIALPRGLMNRLHSMQIARSGGDYVEAAIMGVIASMVVSPCVTPALAGSLIYIVDTGEVATGGLALFFMGLGMGVPLLAVGAFEGALLPKSGDWMHEIKIFFGVLLLFVAVWMLDRVVPGQVTLFIASLLLVVYGFYLSHNKTLDTALVSGWNLVRRGVGFFAILLGAVYLLGAASGGDDYLSPLANISGAEKAETQMTFQKVKTTTELEAALTTAKGLNRPVVLYFSADWCVSCRKLEKRVFTQASVQSALEPYEPIKVDITSYDKNSRELMRRYQVYAPPVLIQLDGDNQQDTKERLVGEVSAENMVQWLR